MIEHPEDYERAPIGAGEPHVPPGRYAAKVLALRVAPDLWEHTGLTRPDDGDRITGSTMSFDGIAEDGELQFTVQCRLDGFPKLIVHSCPLETEFPLPEALARSISQNMVAYLLAPEETDEDADPELQAHFDRQADGAYDDNQAQLRAES